jgi:hypothetical protein
LSKSWQKVRKQIEKRVDKIAPSEEEEEEGDL